MEMDESGKGYANQGFELLENIHDIQTSKNTVYINEIVENDDNNKLFNKEMLDANCIDQQKIFNKDIKLNVNDITEKITGTAKYKENDKDEDENNLHFDDGVILKLSESSDNADHFKFKYVEDISDLVFDIKKKNVNRHEVPSTDDSSDLKWKGVPELTRSQYSLVSCVEVTPEALKVWIDLPEEVKYDPSLEPFRQLYEKEHGRVQNHSTSPQDSVSKVRRLPLVKSAPHLQNNLNNLRIVPDPTTFSDGAAFDSGGTYAPSGHHVPYFPIIGDKEDECTNNDVQPRKTKIAKARYFAKVSMLVACWVFFTVILMMYNEKEENTRNSYIAPEETKSFILELPDNKLTIAVQLSGPFLTENAEKKLNFTKSNSNKNFEVWLERWHLKSGLLESQATEDDVKSVDRSKSWIIALRDDQVDFTIGEVRSSTLTLQSLPEKDTNQTTVFALRLRTTSNQTTPFTLSYKINPLDATTGVIYALLLLCGLYGLIIFEVINRTMAAILVSTTSLAVLTIVGERPSFQEIISWLDMETLLLLFSMMLLVSILAETGMFDSLAVYTFEVTKGKIWPLITLLCSFTAILSSFLDNVTTVLLVAPVTIRLCEVTGLNPVPILMSMVLYSNIGGTATPVGDPPNVIIASNKFVIQAGINFTNFTLHMTLGVILVCVQTYLQLRYWHIDNKKLRHSEPSDVQDLRHQISIWRRAAESLPHLSKDEQVVKERLDRKIRKLNGELEVMLKDSKKRACTKDTFTTTLTDLKRKYKINDKVLLAKASIATIFVVTVFFLHSIPELNKVSLGWTALLGAILLLILADREDLEPILHRVEWSTLLFFAALFVLMEALSKLGLIEYIGSLTEKVILNVEESARLAVAILLMLWVSGLTSAFIDNIPLTTMMVRVVTSLGANPNLNLPLSPLIWALSFGACLGGNGTIIGASANVICAGVAEQHGYKFTFMQFFKIGFPVMIGHLLVTSVYLLVCHCVFAWH